MNKDWLYQIQHHRLAALILQAVRFSRRTACLLIQGIPGYHEIKSTPASLRGAGWPVQVHYTQSVFNVK
jgi:hypothetical protein